ncbi:GntR family transcriptional regulator [Micromonospora pisi]|uniref:GntR family transcriptional regulator n=1 Tax=Micromonospora pisi TaxID=589240 RepID=A0A495JQS5_9ACTN|nr:GntR family transcriptional regulator [Micromonospora pisi]RKR91191.1 GntR family transcriptional regulator [Micromonospora pisi]
MVSTPVGATGKPAGPGTLAPLPARQTLTEDVYQAIKRLIMDHVIPPQGRLSIDQLARDLRVSSTPIRETLVRLESEGLARKEPLRGYSVTPILTLAEIDDLFEFRTLIEPWAAARAARHRDDAGVVRLRAEIDSVGELPDGDSYADYQDLAGHDDRFHRLIAELAGNQHLLNAFARTHCHLHLFRRRYSTPLGSATVAEHRDIAAAVVAGDPDAAYAAMGAHLERARQRLS